MTMKKTALSGLLTLFLFSCDSVTEQKLPVADSVLERDNTEVVKDTTVADMPLKQGELTLTPLKDSPEFPDAKLELNGPENGAKISSNEVQFNYEVKNYHLKHQTAEGTCAKVCANSEQGQHIHLILNNQPYIALYETNPKQKLDDGHYVALSFLSRSYHESIKTSDAYDIRQFTVGKAEPKKVDLTQPMLFYSRPKGEYVGDETNRVLLDFYLVNTDISSTGKKVRATIDGHEFIIPTWQPYLIEGLSLGEHTIKLELIDEDGNLVDSPFNSITRTITLKQKQAS